MNYDKIYDQLIKRAIIRECYCPLTGYVERHHIIPRCVSGSDNIENISILKPEEHYVAHQLLVKMNLYKSHSNYKGLIFAAAKMCSNSKKHKRNNNKLYGWLRRKCAEASSKMNKGRPSARKGKKHLPESIEKMKISHIGNTGRKGQQCSKEHKEKISKSKKGKPGHPMTKFHRKKLKILLIGNKNAAGEKNRGYDHTEYHWIHKNGREEICTRYNLIKNHPEEKLNTHCLGRIIRGTGHFNRGWTLKKINH